MISKIDTLLTVPQEIVRVPGVMANAVGGYVVQLAKFVAEATGDQKAYAHELEQQQPLNDVAVGVNALDSSGKALKTAIRLKSVEAMLGCVSAPNKIAAKQVEAKLEDAKVLRNTGYGVLKLAALRAKKSEIVPPMVTQQVVLEAIEHGADPGLQGFVPSGKMEPVAELLDAFNDITLLHKS